MKFEIGDKVRAIKPPDGDKDLLGEEGIVVENKDDSHLSVLVNFEISADGWWCEEDSLIKVKPLDWDREE